MVRSRGWEWVKKYYTGKVQAFATNLLLKDKEPIGNFENERRELIGLKKLLGVIDNDIKALDEQQNKTATKK